MMREEELYEDPFTAKVAAGFTMNTISEPEDLLFPDDRAEERTLSIWDDVDWWTGEAKDASFFTQPPAKIYESQEFKEEAQTFAENPELLKLPQFKEQTFPQRRWFQQDNGRIPLKRLVKVGGSNYLRADAAQAFRAMKRAAKKDGVNITFSSATQSGYRDYETQERLFHEKGDSDTGGLAADPGTSNHGWGMAIDIGPEGRAWVAQHGTKYGFHGIANESWHFDFKPTPGMEYKPPRRKGTVRKSAMKAPAGRKVGAQDLSSTVPVSDPSSFMDAVLSLVDEERSVETPKGKRRVNLSDIPKPKNQAEVIQYARQVARKYGWTGKQWLAINAIIDGGTVGKWTVPDDKAESHWQDVPNPDSSATGIPQRLLSAHPFAPGEEKKWQDPRYQVRWLMRYINQRYDGDPMAALRHKVETGWY